jgi:hypothetical protein
VAGRYLVWNYSYENFKKFPLSGVGAGNFVFWVKYNWHGKQYYHHLPHNQYLVFSSSLGLIGLLIFLIFIFQLWMSRERAEKWLFFVILIIIFFNHYLWFPESLLLFWMIASFENEKKPKRKPQTKISLVFFIFLILLFLSSNVFHFSELHPKNWAKETRTNYDYGFWYKEKDNSGKEFRWTKDKAGIYIFLDKEGLSPEIKLFCGAPLSVLEQKRQRVKIYWRGKLYEEIIFKENGDCSFRIEDKSLEGGFLEFRIQPSFNLKKMRIGEETRDLGIQVYEFELYSK